MKIINNSCIEVLPALYLKKKTSTIRKAWEKVKIIDKIHDIIGISANKDGTVGMDFTCDEPTIKTIEKPCDYEVGETVEMYWNYQHLSRISVSKDQLKELYLLGIDPFSWIKCGRFKITSIEKVEITNNKKEGTINFLDRVHAYSWDIDQLVNKEGFKSLLRMLEYLELYAKGLEKPKPFWKIEGRWLHLPHNG